MKNDSTPQASAEAPSPGVVSDALLDALLAHHPAPWKVEYHKQELHWAGPCVLGVADANGNYLWDCATHSGDGDTVYLTPAATEALVAFVNASANAVVRDAPEEHLNLLP